MSHQPQCRDCGKFVGRSVSVLKFEPLVVVCAGCTFDRAAAQVKAEIGARQVMAVYQ